MDTDPLLVLLVEDLEDAAQSTAELFTLSGYAVRVADCGPAALRLAAEYPPDVILLDIGLPGPDGWDVAQRLRREARGKQPFIIAVTGYGTDGDRWRSANSGIDVHLVKPADPRALLELLRWIQTSAPARPGEQPPPSAS